MKILSYILLLALPFAAIGEEVKCDTRLMFGGWSKHQKDNNYNERHNILGVNHCDYTLFYMKNSKYEESIVFGKDVYKKNLTDSMYLALMFGIASGYTDGEEPVYQAMGRLHKTFGDNFGVNIGFIPGYVYTLNLSWQISDGKTFDVPEENSKWAIGYGYGGFGQAEVTYNLNEKMNIRAFFYNKEYGWSDTWSWDAYNNDVWLWQEEFFRPSGHGIALDYYPWKNDVGFYAGLSYNNSEYTTIYHAYANGGGQAGGDINIFKQKTHVYHGDEVHGKVDWDPVSAEFGFRYGNPFNNSGWSWYADIGVISATGIDGVAKYYTNEDNQDSVAEVEEKLNEWIEEYEKPKYKKKLVAIPRLLIGFQYTIPQWW